MCLSPIKIKNPFYNLGRVGLNAFHDTTHYYIQVPCGNCPQCTSLRQSFYLQRIQMESLRSYLFMFTLTYNQQSLQYVSAGDYTLAIPVLSDVQNMFKRLRNRGYKFRVSYVSEYGSRHHRPHFHGILALDKSLGCPRSLEKQWHSLMMSEWRRNYGDRNDLRYEPLFDPVYKRCRLTTFDFHYIEPILGHDNDCSFYVSKYITKYDSWTKGLIGKISTDPSLSGEEQQYLIKAIRPRCNTSKDFGSWKDPIINEYIQKCASRESHFRYPQFYDIYTGKQMPMSPYYGRHVVGFEHAYERLLLSSYSDDMSTYFESPDSVLDQNISLSCASREYDDFSRKLEKLYNRLEI